MAIEAMLELVRRYADAQEDEGPYWTEVPGLIVLRTDCERPPNHILHNPALCIVLQGSKWTMFGGERYDYHAGQALLVSLQVPAIGRVVEATPDKPFLGVVIQLDFAIMREVLEELETRPSVTDRENRSILVTDFEGPLADCALRYARLLETPAAIPMLAAATMRELCYWLLTGPHGGDIYQIALASGVPQRMIEALHMLRHRYAETIRVEDLARAANISPSAFHQRFKELTGTTPVQYQKQVRLLEARRLLLQTEDNVEAVAEKVGYESASQFSREYARTFGNPPRRDARLRPSYVTTIG